MDRFSGTKRNHLISAAIRDISSEDFLSKIDGMPIDCAVNLDHIQTVSKGKIGSLITTISSEKRKQVRDADVFALHL